MAAQGLKNIYPGPIDWESRRKAVEHFLLGRTKEGANLILDPKTAPTLSKGFNGGYQYPERYALAEPGRPAPIKNHFSHVHDGLQYLAGGAISLLKRKPSVEVPAPQYTFTHTEAKQTETSREEYGITAEQAGGAIG